MVENPKSMPIPDADSLPFWEGAKRHELLAQQCAECSQWRWPPQGVCPNCHSWNSVWTRLAGHGHISSYVVVQQGGVSAAFANDAPYVIAKIEMDGTDGLVIMTSNVVNCPWEDVYVGMHVRVTFDDVDARMTLPKFAPV
jgi:uncharacterized OB-fold protein